ncbi:MAG TPA: DUF6498-containing protein, partial [Candidatus Omnitrophota bacterium]|nr:DUF6498-containing protein [Candidatus Omnitrophota bacterium]
MKFWETLPTSSILLVSANLIPVVGVIHGGWNLFDILFIYWAESAIIGFFNVLKMMSAGGKKSLTSPIDWLIKLFMCGFFTVHFG